MRVFARMPFKALLAPVIGIMKGLTDPMVGLLMGQTAENLAHRFGQLLPSEQCEVAERTYRDLVEPILRETLSLPTTVTASPS